MRIVFFGTPSFAVASLEALVAAGHELALVVTNPDRRRGRRSELIAPEVKRAAITQGLQLRQPESVRDPALIDELSTLEPELGVVVAYGQFIPRALRRLPRHGMINVHGSLLPRHRGASPVSQAILDGDTEAGVTIIEVARRMDAGAMLGKRATSISAEDTTGTLSARLAQLGGALLVDVIDAIARGEEQREQQDHAAATLANKLSKGDGILDWRRSALELERRVRAMSPWPLASFQLAGRGRRAKQRESIIVERACCAPEPEGAPAPGTILKLDQAGLVVATGTGALRLEQLRPPGKSTMSAADFARGRRLEAGHNLEGEVP